MHFFWLALVAGATVWEEAFSAHPDPTPKDSRRDYFVVHVEDPGPMSAAHAWTVEAAFPIEDHWLLSHPRGHAKRSPAAFQFGARQVYPSLPSRLTRRAAVSVEQEFGITDPLFKDQWYLYNRVEEGHDMNVLPVWRRNITGRGVTVAIVDDGLDYDHPDFAESFSHEGSWDFNRHTRLPKPLLDDDTHGTRCAGEIAAGINNVCGVGIAPGAKVAGIRILSGYLSHDDEARSLIHRHDINDIYSCSWGPPDDGKTIDGPPTIVRRAELAGIETGRHGKGSIYVVASGNGDLYGDNCNFDGYTNSIYSITISAVDRQNSHPYYSESCSANMVTTYSSNYFDKIVTSDRLDPLNPDEPKCTNQHSGTSAAAPIAAAVFALVLEQRPELTWRDLQYLARDTAKKFHIEPVQAPVPPNRARGDWQRTADGHYYHNSFGFGLLDADAIVKRAETWELVKPQTWYFLPIVDSGFAITPTSQSTLEVSKPEWEDANMDHIEHVRVRMSWQHERRGELSFVLVSPAGVVSELAAPRQRDISSDPVFNWEFLSVVHWNETGAGTWTLKVTGPDGYIGEVKNWQLKLFGQAKDTGKVRRFSEVWDEYEPPAYVVKDPLEESSTSTEPTEAASKTVKTSTETSPPDPTSDAAADDGQPEPTSMAPDETQPTPILQPTGWASTSASSSDDVDASRPTRPAKPETPDSEEKQPEHSGWSSHSLGYYVVASLVGLVILSCVAAPVIYFGYLKKQLQGTYDPLADNGYELNDYADEFEIDGSDQDDGEVDADEEFRESPSDIDINEAAGGREH